MNITNSIVNLVSNVNLKFNDQSIHNAKLALIDYLACGIAGSKSDNYKKLLNSYKSTNSKENFTVFNCKNNFGITSAVFINSYAAHVLDYDDQHGPARGHPSCILFPALIAVAEKYNKNTEDILKSYIVGLEVMAQLGILIGKKHYENGFHQTATLGTIAATLACLHLIESEKETILNGLSIATSQASGLRDQFGGDGKPVNVAFAALKAILCFDIAQTNLTFNKNPLDVDIGFLKIHNPSLKTEKLSYPSETWQIENPGLYFKPYPCCVASHFAIEASKSLLDEIDIKKIKAINVIFPIGGDRPLQYIKPSNGIEGRFSIEYILAIFFTYKNLKTQYFEDIKIDNDINSLMNIISRSYTNEEASPDPTKRATTVIIEYYDGRIFKNTCNKLTNLNDLNEKLISCTNNEKKSKQFYDDFIKGTNSDFNLVKEFMVYG